MQWEIIYDSDNGRMIPWVLAGAYSDTWIQQNRFQNYDRKKLDNKLPSVCNKSLFSY